jgi:hypothetical protein
MKSIYLLAAVAALILLSCIITPTEARLRENECEGTMTHTHQSGPRAPARLPRRHTDRTIARARMRAYISRAHHRCSMLICRYLYANRIPHCCRSSLLSSVSEAHGRVRRRIRQCEERGDHPSGDSQAVQIVHRQGGQAIRTCAGAARNERDSDAPVNDARGSARWDAHPLPVCRSRVSVVQCYYIGGSEDSATSLLRTISRPLQSHMPSEKICERLKGMDQQVRTRRAWRIRIDTLHSIAIACCLLWCVAAYAK